MRLVCGFVLSSPTQNARITCKILVPKTECEFYSHINWLGHSQFVILSAPFDRPEKYWSILPMEIALEYPRQRTPKFHWPTGEGKNWWRFPHFVLRSRTSWPCETSIIKTVRVLKVSRKSLLQRDRKLGATFILEQIVRNNADAPHLGTISKLADATKD